MVYFSVTVQTNLLFLLSVGNCLPSPREEEPGFSTVRAQVSGAAWHRGRLGRGRPGLGAPLGAPASAPGRRACAVLLRAWSQGPERVLSLTTESGGWRGSGRRGQGSPTGRGVGDCVSGTALGACGNDRPSLAATFLGLQWFRSGKVDPSGRPLPWGTWA